MDQCYLITTEFGFKFMVWAEGGVKAAAIAQKAIMLNPDWFVHGTVKTVEFVPLVMQDNTETIKYWGLG